MGIKARRGCIIQGNRGDNPHFHSPIPGHLSNGFKGFELMIQSQNAHICFFSAGKGRGRSSGICDKTIFRRRSGYSVAGKFIHAKGMTGKLGRKRPLAYPHAVTHK